MRIGVIGGGPAGLYFALLMKARDPRHEIHVMEQNPPDATYGWGLVFAAPTLRLLADSDPEFYADLRKDCAELDTMEIGHRGVRVAVKGNRWARVSRIAMLGTLQRHCLQRGVKIEFQARADDVDCFAGFDLVVVADGVASSIRAKHADWFQPSFERYRNKFAWYGTTALIPALSLIFRQSEHGIFIAHCYQYSPTHSTFLVECDPQAWSRAGLDHMSDEESLRYCAAVFRDDLDGQPLLSNKSSWFNAAIIRNRALEPRQRRPAGRRAAHGAFLDRLGNPHGPAGRHRAGRRAPAAAATTFRPASRSSPPAGDRARTISRSRRSRASSGTRTSPRSSTSTRWPSPTATSGAPGRCRTRICAGWIRPSSRSTRRCTARRNRADATGRRRRA